MEESLSYMIVTPYTIARSRTGGVIARLLSRLDLELIAAQVITPDEKFAAAYAAKLREQADPASHRISGLLSDYIIQNLGPSGGRKHRSLLLLFRGHNPCRKLSDIGGALYSENISVESVKGETIRDTYADLIYDTEDNSQVRYFEPAVLTPRCQEHADANLALFADYLEGQPNVVENLVYEDPAKIERTLVIIKPDNWNYASSKPGTIIDMFSRTGLRIIACKIHQMSIAQALEFYKPVKAALKDRLAPLFGRKAKELLEAEFKLKLSPATERALTDYFGVDYAADQFSQIVEFMSGIRPELCPTDQINQPGKVKCMILVYEGANSIAKIRDVLGPTDPGKAPGGTIRREFGSNVMVNTAHASDSKANARREMEVVKIDENNSRQIILAYLKAKQSAGS